MTHQQLVALIASANPSGAANLASKLSQASFTITSIGEDLKAYVAGLAWHGEGGDAFRAWGGQTASATLRLGEYSRGASQWMEEVAQAIGEAKAAMPPISETTRAQNALTKANGAYETATDPANRNDPDARGLARTAQSDVAAAEARIDVLRGEAALRLRKLAQTYEFTAHQVNAETPPTFPPPSSVMPESVFNVREPTSGEGPTTPERLTSGDRPGAFARAANSGDFAAGSEGRVEPRPVADLPHVDISESSGRPPRVEPTTRMEIDGLATLPTATSPSPASPSASPPPAGATDPLGMQPTQTPPVSAAGGTKTSWQPAPPVMGRPGQSGGTAFGTTDPRAFGARLHRTYAARERNRRRPPDTSECDGRGPRDAAWLGRRRRGNCGGPRPHGAYLCNGSWKRWRATGEQLEGAAVMPPRREELSQEPPGRRTDRVPTQ